MKSKIIFLLIIMFFLNGLNNARELNELAVVSAIGIDLDEEGNYLITAQILNPKKENSSGSGSGSSSGSSEIVVFKSTNTSIQSSLRHIIEESPQKLYIAHMELLLLSEKVATEKEALDILNFFIRDNEGKNDFTVVITKDCTPQKVLEITTPMESNPAKNIKDTIISAHRYRGIGTDNVLSDDVSMFRKASQTPILTCIEIIDPKNSLNCNKKEENAQNSSDNNSENNNTDNMENQENSQEQESALENLDDKESKLSSGKEQNIKVSTLAFFKEETLSGFLLENECYIYNILLNKAKGGILEVGKDKDLMVIDQISSNTKLTPKIENGEYIIDISVNMDFNITETGENIRFDSNDQMKSYEKKAEEHLKEKIEELINKSKNEYDCDIFSFGNVFYRKKNKEYNTLYEKYGKDYFKYIKTNVDVKINFPSEGGIDNIW